MINIFDKLGISYHINKTKNNVSYDCYKDIADNSSLHRVRINDVAFISIEKHNDDNLGTTHFSLRYYFPDKPEHNIRPDQQSYFDKLFISRMYSKMLNNYIVKNRMSNNIR